MEVKDKANRMWGKIGSGVLFVISCFVAMYVLVEFHESIGLVAIAAVLMLISSFLFLNAVFSEKAKEWAPEEEKTEEPIGAADGEFKLKITKHMKEMESTQKEMVEVLKNQNQLLKGQLEKMEHEIYMLSEKQEKQAKSIIKFNKENARQLAISERETLEHVMQELKKAIEDNAVAVPAAVAELEEVSEEELFAVSDLPGDDEYVMPELPLPEAEPVVEEVPELEIPEMPADIEIPVPEEIISEPEVVAEEAPAPAADPLAGLSSSDPGAMMTPEDIAKLLEAMGN